MHFWYPRWVSVLKYCKNDYIMIQQWNQKSVSSEKQKKTVKCNISEASILEEMLII